MESLNLKAHKRAVTDSPAILEKEYREYLTKEKRIKAVTLCFTDIEGRFHMLDYDKKFLLDNAENLTFDGSSIRGFSLQSESDLRLGIDWSSIFWLPADIFGPGKVIFFANILSRDRGTYVSDFRGQLQNYAAELNKSKGITALASAEIEGLLSIRMPLTRLTGRF